MHGGSLVRRPRSQRSILSSSLCILIAYGVVSVVTFSATLTAPPPWNVILAATKSSTTSARDTPPASRSSDSSLVPRNSETLPRFLMGIFTRQEEKDMRDRIRNTYLSYLSRRFPDNDELRHNICSLHKLLERQLERPDLCRLVYTFVMGANLNGSSSSLIQGDMTTKKLQQPDRRGWGNPRDTAADTITPMTVAMYHNRSEPDVTYLNIRENMNDGKTLTWFHYASVLQDEHLWLDFELIAKLDTDTLFVPPLFWKWLRSQHGTRPANRVYGGYVRPRSDCGPCETLLTASDTYINGGFYFLSGDLARFVTSPQSPLYTQNLSHDRAAEDVLMAQLVHSHPPPIDVWNIGYKGRDAFAKHPVKSASVWDTYWRIISKHLDEDLDDAALYYVVTGKNLSATSVS